MRRLVLPLLLACLAPAARADRFELKDGSAVSGALIREEAGVLVVLTASGEKELRAADVTAVVAEEVPPALQKKAEKARLAWFQRQEKEVKALIRRHARARSAEDRAAAVGSLQAIAPEAQLGPLADAADESDAATRELALARLKELPIAGATDALLRIAMCSKRSDSRDGAHLAAVARDAERARTVYEAVLESPTKASRRFHALGHLAAMGRKESVPGLILALERINSEVRASLATAGQSRQSTVNLGSTGGAATQVPIELPQMQLIEVQASSSVTVLRQLQEETQRVLRGLSGVDKGKDPAAWRKWYEDEKK